MTWDKATRNRAYEWLAKGYTIHQVSTLTAVPVATVGRWAAHLKSLRPKAATRRTDGKQRNLSQPTFDKVIEREQRKIREMEGSGE